MSAKGEHRLLYAKWLLIRLKAIMNTACFGFSLTRKSSTKIKCLAGEMTDRSIEMLPGPRSEAHKVSSVGLL